MWPGPAFFELHRDLPREGPGTDAVTLRAIGMLPDLPPDPVVLDLACGPGGHTLVLARTLRVPVLAVDLHRHFVEVVGRRAADSGLGHLVTARHGDMRRPPGVDPGSVHLIWCEGALYQIGFEDGLGLWRSLLADGGIVAASEAVWTVDEVPDEVRGIWDEEYPSITDAAGCIARAHRAGYDVLDHFLLEPADWWTDYYGPMQERVEKLRPRALQDPELAGVLEEAEREMDMHRRFGHTYSYAFLVMRVR